MRLNFLKEFIKPIQSGKKIQTTRPSLNAKITRGSEVLACTRVKVGEKAAFGMLLVHEIEVKTLGSFDSDDAVREGYNTLDEFKMVWKKLYRAWNENQKVYVIRFSYQSHRS